MSFNSTGNELDERLESFITRFFVTIGTLSSVLSFLTFYLLVKKSYFCSKEVRILLLILQISAFLNNFHFCILFIPFIYPYLGGGFCNGLLCTLRVPFHYGMVDSFWLLTVILLCASFIVLLFARLQTLLNPWSRLHWPLRYKLCFYVYTFMSMLTIPITFIFTETPDWIEERSVMYFGLDWIARKRVFGVFNGNDDSSRQAIMWLIIYTILGNIIIFGSITAALFVMILHKIYTSKINQKSTHALEAYRAKIKNSIVILSQMLGAFCLGVVPLCLLMGVIGTGVDPVIEKKVLLCEVCLTLLSPLNSIIFIFGNRQYVQIIRDSLRRMSMRRRTRSISIDPRY